MLVSIVGGHGQIARLLTPLLRSSGHGVRGLVRSADQFDDLHRIGADPVPCDLEGAGPRDVDAALSGSDVVVFAAGAGPGSGAERKLTLDRDGAIAAVESAVRVGARRFVMISAMGTDDPPTGDEVFSVYLRAKAAADDAVRAADLASVVVRPGRLTDGRPTGLVTLARHVERGEITRADVAAVLAELITTGTGDGHTIEVVGGDTPIAEAVAGLG